MDRRCDDSGTIVVLAALFFLAVMVWASVKVSADNGRRLERIEKRWDAEKEAE